ncbi:MFS transporter [Gordonia desulfuricans]|uniref:MFS transporter n=1 Tax=Gordonia desulfuricans TaxID=89051 RepID=A0A7K3LKC7_9ACTN|nr:MFS transporter [Gordonia desulfuricans]NDK88658.1 MFS transporter [Gordonia desulfuricans]
MTTSTARNSGFVVMVLAAGQFLMTLDSSVMNVSMATVAEDVGTTITGVQTAITLYTLVMATLMITGGKIGGMIGRRRAFGVGLVIYGAGSLITALAPNLPVLLLGWSLLEGIGAALIMPAIVSLVASNVGAEGRTAAYGLVAAAGAMAVAVGPLLGGTLTTFASWRWVFVGEVVVVVVILLALRTVVDTPPTPGHLDVISALASIIGLGMIVFGVLRSGEWGWVRPTPGGPEILRVSPTIWLVGVGMVVMYGFVHRQAHLTETGREPLVDVSLLRNRQLTGGLTMFFAQFTVQAGVFFTVPLFLSVVLELSALGTGVRILPLSIALIAAAIGIPKLWPQASPRRVIRLGLFSMVIGVGLLVAGIDPGANAAVVLVPMLFLGLGLGALSSQLGAVTVSAVDDDHSTEVGGLQNTATNLGASLGTALIGSVLIATLTSSVLSGIDDNPAVPASVAEQATTELASGVPFVSTTQLHESLAEAGVTGSAADAIVEVNADSRLMALRVALSVSALLAIAALFGTGRIPQRAPGAPSTPTAGKGRSDDDQDP